MRSIRLQDGGERYLNELPRDGATIVDPNPDVMAIVIEKLDMELADQKYSSCFNEMMRAQLPEHLMFN